MPKGELTTAFNRGNSYLISGQFDDALIEFNHAADISPNNGTTTNDLVSRFDIRYFRCCR